MTMVIVVLPIFLTAQGVKRYGVITTRQKTNQVRTCTKDGLADMIYFWPPTFAFQTGLVITDTNDIILKYNVRSRYNFEGEEPGVCRVYGLSYIGLFEPLTIGKPIDSLQVKGQLIGVTNNYVTVTKVFTQAGEITTLDGAHEAFICLGDNRADILPVKSTTNSTEPYAYALTNEAGIILRIFDQPTINFDTATESIYYIHGISYSGQLSDAIGESIEGFIASTECYQISTSRITVHIVQGAEIKPVVISAAADSLYICTTDAAENKVIVSKSAESFPFSAYIVTDKAGNIIGSSTNDTFDFSAYKENEIHIYAIGHYGQLTPGKGESIFTAPLAAQCYELSFNFLVLQSLPVTRSTVSASQPGVVTFCAGDALPDILFLSNSLQGSSDYLYVITDLDGRILSTQLTDSLDLERIPTSSARIAGVSFNGVLNSVEGQIIDQAIFSNQCFVISDNYIEIKKAIVAGGQVSSMGEGDLCIIPGRSLSLGLTTTSSSDQNYFFIVQDEQKRVLQITDSALVINANWSADSLVVTGMSVFGNRSLEVGDSIDLSTLEGCLALSSNQIRLNLVHLQGSSITANGVDTLDLCLQDDKNELVIFQKSYQDGDYAFAFLDKNLKVVGVLQGDTLVDEELVDSAVYIVGVNYAETLPFKIGESLTEAPACGVYSSNRIVIRSSRLLDFNFTSDRGDTLYFCANSTVLDSVAFEIISAEPGQSQALVLVDQTNQVLAIADDQLRIKYTETGTSNLKIKGVVFTGDFLLNEGQNLNSAEISTGCSKIMEQDLSIFIGDPNGVEGGIVASDKGTSWDVCVSDGKADVITMSKTTASTSNYSYVVTSSDGIILSVSSNAAINFEGSGGGLVRIYGLSHANPLPNILGTNISDVLPIGCYNTSINYVTVNRTAIEDFSLQVVGNSANQIFICNVDPDQDTLYTEIVGSTGGKQGLLITSLSGIILYLDSTSLALPLSDTLEGTYNLWGFIYSGHISAKVGDQVATTALSNQCFNRSRVPIVLNISDISGGEVALAEDNVSNLVCYGNGYADNLGFRTSGSGQYAYLITDDQNHFIISTENSYFDFEGTATPDNYRVYGISYTGEITVAPGTDIHAVTSLVSGCFMLSANYISVPKVSVTVGKISIENGTSPFIICKDETANLVSFSHEASTGEHYAYIVASPDDRVVGVFDTSAIDFNNFPAGLCLVYGLAYDGDLLPTAGQLINQARFANGCFAVTGTFLEIIKAIPDGGEVFLSGGVTEVTICVGDTESDRFVFDNNSNSLSAYQYFITDTHNVILALPQIPVFDFESMDTGVSRVWGAAYTGNILVGVGDTLTESGIASDCYELSNNFITISKVNAGEACGRPLQEEPELQVAAFPIPVTNQLSVAVQKKKLDKNPIEIRIFDPFQKVWLKNSYFSPAENFNTTVNVEELKKGMYVLEVKVGYKVEVIKFLKY